MIDFKPRALMMMAIEEMRRSVAEPRLDGKMLPRVGAVLSHVGDNPPPHGPRIIKAHRGELRVGDHAEFTLLERKNRDRALDDCVLFATLEPCAPGARKHPKLGCAERIVLARIKEVWIGIEDPDPTVARKGIEYLRENGVTIHMFDRDLQEIIETENSDFLQQARERAGEASKEKKKIVLSSLEAVRPAVDWSNLSTDALNRYRKRADIEETIDSDDFKLRLQRQGLLSLDNKILKPTGFANILFGSEPRDSSPQAAVLATIHFPDGTEENRDFDGPQALVPEGAMRWLRDKLPNVIDRSDAVRQESDDVIFTLVREGLVNAIVHRDYDIEQAKCQLTVYPSHIEIHSPGAPVDPITLEQLQRFDAPMLSRNPIIHFVFAKMRLAEERGLGLKSLREETLQIGLPQPKYEWRNPYLILTIFLTPESAVSVLPKEILASLSERERIGWQWLASVGSTQSAEYANHFSVDPRTARRHLNRFENLGLVKKRGAGNATKYVVK